MKAFIILAFTINIELKPKYDLIEVLITLVKATESQTLPIVFIRY